MPPGRKRRAEEDVSVYAEERHDQHEPGLDDDGRDGAEGDEGDEGTARVGGIGSIAQLSKNLVRYALACEYSRLPIKRQEINQKGTSAHCYNWARA